MTLTNLLWKQDTGRLYLQSKHGGVRQVTFHRDLDQLIRDHDLDVKRQNLDAYLGNDTQVVITRRHFPSLWDANIRSSQFNFKSGYWRQKAMNYVTVGDWIEDTIGKDILTPTNKLKVENNFKQGVESWMSSYESNQLFLYSLVANKEDVNAWIQKLDVSPDLSAYPGERDLREMAYYIEEAYGVDQLIPHLESTLNKLYKEQVEHFIDELPNTKESAKEPTLSTRFVNWFKKQARTVASALSL